MTTASLSFNGPTAGPLVLLTASAATTINSVLLQLVAAVPSASAGPQRGALEVNGSQVALSVALAMSQSELIALPIELDAADVLAVALSNSLPTGWTLTATVNYNGAAVPAPPSPGLGVTMFSTSIMLGSTGTATMVTVDAGSTQWLTVQVLSVRFVNCNGDGQVAFLMGDGDTGAALPAAGPTLPTTVGQALWIPNFSPFDLGSPTHTDDLRFVVEAADSGEFALAYAYMSYQQKT